MKLQQWQAILIGYGVLLVMSETELAPLAVIMAWGVAGVYLIDTVSQGGVTQGLFSSGTAAAGGTP